MGSFFEALAWLVDTVLNVLWLVVMINALLSWVRPDPSNPIVMFLDRASDLMCAPIRRLMPTVLGGFDFAPLIAMLILWFIKMFVVRSLQDFAIRL